MRITKSEQDSNPYLLISGRLVYQAEFLPKTSVLRYGQYPTSVAHKQVTVELRDAESAAKIKIFPKRWSFWEIFPNTRLRTQVDSAPLVRFVKWWVQVKETYSQAHPPKSEKCSNFRNFPDFSEDLCTLLKGLIRWHYSNSIIN